jgi:hypothetical protein
MSSRRKAEDQKIAQHAYRKTWESWLLAKSPKRKRELEEIMDQLQPQCVDPPMPGPDWDAFIDTLPGYREWWDGQRAKLEERV